MKTKNLIALLISILIITAIPVVANAADCDYTSNTVSRAATYQLGMWDAWQFKDENNKDLTDKKESLAAKVIVHTHSLTMYNNPLFRITNSPSATTLVKYCNSFLVEEAGKTKTHNENAAGKGVTCYASLKSSVLQVGTDTISLCFSAE